MKHTRFKLSELHDRQTGESWQWEEFPMNTPVMLVRNGKFLRFKRLRNSKLNATTNHDPSTVMTTN